jgi:hypothetical protein
MPSVICTSGVHCANCQASPKVMAALNIEKCEGPFTPQPTERDRALQAQSRGETYVPPGKCGGCNQ